MKGIEVVFTWEAKRGIRTLKDKDFDNGKNTVIETVCDYFSTSHVLIPTMTRVRKGKPFYALAIGWEGRRREKVKKMLDIRETGTYTEQRYFTDSRGSR